MRNRFIAKLLGYGELSSREIDALERATAMRRRYGPRHDLIREGDQPGPVFVMLDGWATRYKILPNGSRQIMAFLMPGDACDLHIGLLAEMDHSIQTITNAEVATISRSVMDELMHAYPGVARAMYVAQLVDEGTLRAWIVSMGRRSSIERVAHLFLELSLRADRTGVNTGDAVELPLTQGIMADALGMTAVHVNRTLQELRKTGAVHLSRGLLRIDDAEMLTRIAGFDATYLHKRSHARRVAEQR